jgi:hypothetical protein
VAWGGATAMPRSLTKAPGGGATAVPRSSAAAWGGGDRDAT